MREAKGDGQPTSRRTKNIITQWRRRGKEKKSTATTFEGLFKPAIGIGRSVYEGFKSHGSAPKGNLSMRKCRSLHEEPWNAIRATASVHVCVNVHGCKLNTLIHMMGYGDPPIGWFRCLSLSVSAVFSYHAPGFHGAGHGVWS